MAKNDVLFKNITMSNRKVNIIFLLLYSFVVKFFNSLASPLFSQNSFQADNNVFYQVGKSMLNGKVLYKELVDNKGPYTFFINVIANLCSYRHIGLYIIECFILFFSLYLMYKLIRLYIKNDILSIIGACLYGVLLNNSYITQGMSRTECYTMPFILASLYIVLYCYNYETTISNIKMLYIGVFAGITLLINIKHIAIIVVILCIYMVYHSVYIMKNDASVFKVIVNNIFLLIYGFTGFIIGLLPYLMYAFKTGSIGDGIYCILILPFKYVGRGVSLFYNSTGFIDSITYHISIHLVFFIILFIALTIVLIMEKNLYIKISYILSLFVTISYTALANAPYVHYLVMYFIFLISIYIFITKKFENINIKVFVTIPCVILIFILTLRLGYYDVSKQYLAISYCNNELLKSISKYSDNVTDEKILTLGYIPEVYTAVNNVIAFKYFFTMNNTYKGAKEFVDAQCEYVKNNEPKIVVVNLKDSFVSFSDEKRKDTEIALESNYLLVDEVKSHTTNGNYYIYLKRKS